jgi:hypothetical protein
VLLLAGILFAGEVEFLMADSTSRGKLVLRENLGAQMVIDSVTVCAIKNGVIYVTRNKEFFGAYPTAFNVVEAIK